MPKFYNLLLILDDYMGKGKRKRLARQREIRTLDMELAQISSNKRSSFLIPGIAACLIGVGALGYTVWNSVRTDNPRPAYSVEQQVGNEWAFLDRKIDDKAAGYTDAYAVMRNFVPLGEETGIDGIKLAEVKKSIPKQQLIDIIKQHGFRSTKFDIQASVQIYGVPEEPAYAQQMKDYLVKAENYLHERLEGLDKHAIDWVILKQGDDFSKNYQGKGFIGHSYFDIETIHLRSKTNPNEETKIRRFVHRSGGLQESSVQIPSQEFNYWYLFFSTGRGAIRTPFSEIIPLTTIPISYQYARELGPDAANQADETIAESLSYLLARDIAKEMQIPDGLERIEDFRRKMSDRRYSLVPLGIEWAKKNGMQKALDLYKTSPVSYINNIKSQ